MSAKSAKATNNLFGMALSQLVTGKTSYLATLTLHLTAKPIKAVVSIAGCVLSVV